MNFQCLLTNQVAAQTWEGHCEHTGMGGQSCDAAGAMSWAGCLPTWKIQGICQKYVSVVETARRLITSIVTRLATLQQLCAAEKRSVLM